MSVREPSGVESSLIRNAVRTGFGGGCTPGEVRTVRGKGVSPDGNLFNVAIATIMTLFGSLGFTNTHGSPAPRFGLPSNKYSSDFPSVADCERAIAEQRQAPANNTIKRKIRSDISSFLEISIARSHIPSGYCMYPFSR